MADRLMPHTHTHTHRHKHMHTHREKLNTSYTTGIQLPFSEMLHSLKRRALYVI